jgi:hypothetical protein
LKSHMIENLCCHPQIVITDKKERRNMHYYENSTI